MARATGFEPVIGFPHLIRNQGRYPIPVTLAYLWISMKNCSKCNSTGPFYKKGNRKSSYCTVCFNKYCMERWKDKKQKSILYKGNCCLDCKQQFHYSVYEFHHLDPNSKDYNWSKLRMKSWSNICKELDKCVLLCANCHRSRHWNLGALSG